MKIASNVRDLLLRMTLPEKVGQVFVFTWRNAAQAANDLNLHPGGFIRIYSDAMTVARETAAIQAESAVPLIMAADFERGIGGTISGGIEVVSAMALGATKDELMAYDAGRIIGEEALAIGINMDYAPVLDINSNPENPVINTRSFGEDPAVVARLGVAFMRGLQNAGVGACGKHFPGHGNTNIDSHSNLGEVPGSKIDLNRNELVPFKAVIAAGVDAIMSAHLLVPAIEQDRIPATLSRQIMTGLLRDELGFEGVAVTDALDMGAIVANFPPEKSVPAALNAGCDQLIMPGNPSLCVDILMAAVRRGDVSEERLNEAVARILTLKETREIFNITRSNISELPTRLNTIEHQDRVREIADKSITLVRAHECLPLDSQSQLLCLELGTPQRERSYYLEPRSFADYLEARGRNVTHITAPGSVAGWHNESIEEWADRFRVALEKADVVVLAIYAGIRLGSGRISAGDDITQLVKSVLDEHSSIRPNQSKQTESTSEHLKPVILASFGSPYVIKDFAESNAILCAYSETQASQVSMARALCGEIEACGSEPVLLNA